VAGSQTGDKEDYQQLRDLCDEDTVLLDDTNPMELAKYIQEKDVDLLIGGVKERPIAYKLGVGFCDHNHERKICLAGYKRYAEFFPGSLFFGVQSGVVLDAAAPEIHRRYLRWLLPI